MNVRSRLGTAALLFFAVVLTLASPTGAATKAPYKIGGVFALSGAYAGTDVASYASLQATVAQINASGGVDGHKLEFKVLDNGSDPSKAALATEQLISQYHPNMIFPGIECLVALSGVPVANTAHLISFTGCDNGTDTNPSNFPYNFGSFPPLAVQGVPLVSAAVQVMHGQKFTVGFLHTNDAAGTTMVQYVQKATALRGDKWAGDQAYAQGTPDVTVQLSKLRQAGATVVLLWGQVGSAGTVMKGMRDLNWNAQVIGNTGTTDGTLISEIPSDYVNNFHAYVTANSVRGKTLPAFITLLQKYSKQVQTLSVVGAVHDGILLWAWAVERTHSTNPDTIRKALESLSTLPKKSWPTGLQLTSNPEFSPTQHGELNGNYSRAWGLMVPSQNIEGTYQGKVFTCFCNVGK